MLNSEHLTVCKAMFAVLVRELLLFDIYFNTHSSPNSKPWLNIFFLDATEPFHTSTKNENFGKFCEK